MVKHETCIGRDQDQREGENPMKSVSILPILAVLAVSGMAQSSSPGPAASSPAKSIGMFAYPKNQQNADHQLKDETECYAAAKQQIGVDPQAPPPAPPSAEEQKSAQEQAAKQAAGSTPKGGAVKGSAKGAAGGAAIGAIAGDAGTGAAIGGTAGGVRGRRQQKKAQKEAGQQAAQQTAQAQQQSQAQAQAEHQGTLEPFRRGFAACTH